jgi:hypothetical protein
MSGILAQIDTQVGSINLNISRMLNMGQNCALRFIKPQDDGSGGTELIRAYTESFDRISEAEKEIGDGSTRG